ncbi:MAG: CoA transferase [Candidatus Binatia bacterium]
MNVALDDVRVLDLTNEFWGQAAAAMLGDFGADVIRIEQPGSERPAPVDADWNYLDTFVGRNKRSVAVDLRAEGGRDVARKLAAKVDVVLTDRDLGELQGLGLDYDSVSIARPDIIYARGSGFGAKGPDADLPANDELAAARTGMMPILPQPGQPPLYAAHGQMYTSVFLLFGISVALFHRRRTGEGQQIDTSLLAGNMYGASLDLQAYLAIGGDRMLAAVSRMDAGNPMSGVLYPSADGLWIALTMPDTDRWWPMLAEVAGLDPADARFDTHDKRCGEHRLSLIEELDAAFKKHPADHWRTEFTARQMSADVIEDYSYPADDDAARHNRYILDTEVPGAGNVSTLGFPLYMTDTPAELRRTAPEVGQDTDEVVRELAGLGDDEIASLRSRKVLA